MYIIIYLITIIYFTIFVSNLTRLRKKQELYVACVQNKSIKLSKEKSLDMSNDLDFCTLLVLLEHFNLGEAIFQKPSKRLIIIADILSTKNSAPYQDFLMEERKALIEKTKKSKNLALFKMINALIVFSICISIIVLLVL